MGVQLTATAVHPDTDVLTQVPGNEELPKLSRLPMPTSGGGMPWLPMPIRGGGMPSILPATAEPVEEIIENSIQEE